MYIDFTASDFLTISYNYDTHILVGRWLRPVTPLEARHGYEELLAAARQQKAQYWLIDVRRCHHSSTEIQEWLKKSYYPSLTAHLDVPVYMIYFMAPDMRKDYEVDGQLTKSAATTGQPLHLNLCTTEGECMNWLVQQQQLVPQLQASR